MSLILQESPIPGASSSQSSVLSMSFKGQIDNSTKQREDKLPHDASVFVGSLPSNIDQGDLTKMLMEHLSEHTQIKNIKVVRDSKGGVCAFVQCENASSASSLIQTLHTSVPKPFLGRTLRYEPARAFRSLLISYRKPIQFMRPPGINVINAPPSMNSEIELDLPNAMRIWMHKSAKFHSILYNVEALRAEENRTAEEANDENVLFLHPLKYDEDTLRIIASYFGNLEQFGPLEPLASDLSGGDNDAEAQSEPLHNYPESHRSPRSPSMDGKCWEVKWQHRDDCVSALMTLRRVPHLTVTWAHQPAPSGQTHRTHYHHSPGSSSYSQQFQYHTAPQIFTSPDGSFMHHQPSRKNLNLQDSFHLASAPFECDRRLRQHGNQLWSINPFPRSLSETTCGKEDSQVVSEDNEKCDDQVDSVSVDLLTESVCQELDVPPTPLLDSSSATPGSAGSRFPVTPTDSTQDGSQNMPSKGSDVKENVYFPYKNNRHERDIDPTTLFVGGLEMFGPGAWDEEKVKTFFSRFGGLESVKVVRPLNSCAAFAFVKFDNAEAPARAIYEEHNRIYEGRAMRVQLRDCNPPKNNWKYTRGRGRPNLYHFNSQRKTNNHRPHHNNQEHAFPPLNNENRNTFQARNSADASSQTKGCNEDGGEQVLTPESIGTSPLPVETSSGGKGSEKYREWYEDPEPSTCTPEPSSWGSSASTTGVPSSNSPYNYPLTNGPYFPSMPWMHPYPPPGPYQVPYYPGYAVYPPSIPPQPQSQLPSPSGSDVGGSVGGIQHSWPTMGMYTSFIPYAAVPSRRHLVEQGHLPPSMATQPPVVPTGFIQNEQGTLIAVYQPEVLDRYLAGSDQTSVQVPVQYPPNMHFPLPLQGQDNGSIAPNTFIPGQNRLMPTFPSSPSRNFTPQSPCGTDAVLTSTPFPLYRRQGAGRRDAQHNLNNGRPQNHPRTFNSAVPRPTHGPMHHYAHHTPQPVISGDWARRNMGR